MFRQELCINQKMYLFQELERELPIVKPDFALLNTPEINGIRNDMDWTCYMPGPDGKPHFSH